MTTPDKPKLSIWKRIFKTTGCFLLIPWVIVVLSGFLFYALLMVGAVRVVCILRGRYIIFVHSNSPVWQDYIAAKILPRLPADTVILNWSDHSKWRWFSFPVRVFKLYGGDANFNPIGMVGTSLYGMKTFRFWQPFKDFKHGNEKPLKELETKFFAYIDRTRT